MGGTSEQNHPVSTLLTNLKFCGFLFSEIQVQMAIKSKRYWSQNSTIKKWNISKEVWSRTSEKNIWSRIEAIQSGSMGWPQEATSSKWGSAVLKSSPPPENEAQAPARENHPKMKWGENLFSSASSSSSSASRSQQQLGVSTWPNNSVSFRAKSNLWKLSQFLYHVKDFRSNRKNWSILERGGLPQSEHIGIPRGGDFCFSLLSVALNALPFLIKSMKKRYAGRNIFLLNLSYMVRSMQKLTTLLNVFWLLSQNSSWQTMFQWLFCCKVLNWVPCCRIQRVFTKYWSS